jgi:hypothetical protein
MYILELLAEEEYIDLILLIAKLIAFYVYPFCVVIDLVKTPYNLLNHRVFKLVQSDWMWISKLLS